MGLSVILLVLTVQRAQDSGLPARLTVTNAFASGLEIRVAGDVNLRDDLQAKQLILGRSLPLNADAATEFVKHLIWTWKDGDIDTYIANWVGSDKGSQRAVFNPANFQKNREIARSVHTWTLRGRLLLNDHIVLFVERAAPGQKNAISIIVVTRCGERLCQTNELAKDPLATRVFTRAQGLIEGNIEK